MVRDLYLGNFHRNSAVMLERGARSPTLLGALIACAAVGRSSIPSRMETEYIAE